MYQSTTKEKVSIMYSQKNFYINGEWVQPQSSIEAVVINPTNEEQIGTISLASKKDVDIAVASARNAFATYSQTSLSQRLEWLKKLLAITKRRYDEIAHILTLELGAPITMSKEQQMDAGVGHLEGFIEALEAIKWEEKLNNGDCLVREPVGVCGLITPWNWPINQIVLKVVPALATGCTCVLKPSEFTPLNAGIYAEMIDEAGFPAGAFNLINGNGEDAGSALSSHLDVDMVSFTGSKRAGVLVSKAAADTVKRVTLELGGKSPNLIFADSDLETVVPASVEEVFNNSGQSCDAPTRMLVEKSVYDAVVQMACNIGEQKQYGDPKKEGEHMGPLVSDIQYERVQALIKAGIDEKAKLICGGLGRPKDFDKGYYARATIFADVTPDMRISREEIFGPVLTIGSFDNEEEAIKLANDTEYGLAAYLQTSDPVKAKRVAMGLRAGNVHINGGGVNYGSPFGGYKQSGSGREGGVLGLEEFLEVKALHVG